MTPNPRRRRPIGPALALASFPLAFSAGAASAQEPSPFQHNPVQAVARRVLHREVARPLFLSGYAGYNYEQFPHRRPVPAGAVSRPHPLATRLGRLFHHP